VTGVGLVYRIFDFLDTFLGRVHFLGFCKHDGLVVMGVVSVSVNVVYVGRDEVVEDLPLSVSAGGTPSTHKWGSGYGGSRRAGNLILDSG
jgi:hypothetical protein